MQAKGVAGQLALNASCDWTAAWLAAYDRGDAAAMSTALRVMKQVPTWTEIVEVDGGGVVAQQQRFADGASAGAPESFREEFTAACDTSAPVERL